MSTSSVPKAKNTESFSNSRTSFTGAALKPPKLQSFQRLSSSDSKVCQLYYDRFLPYNWQHDSTHTFLLFQPFSPSPTSQSFAIPGLTGASGSAVSSKQPLPGTSSSSSSSSSQKSSMQSAMKRLQMVKKKAAQKNFNQQQMRVIRR